MQGNKVVISFDPDTQVSIIESKRIWQFNEFREFIKQLALKGDTFVLYLITTSTSSSYITSIQKQVNDFSSDGSTLLDNSRVITCGSESIKKSKLQQFSVDIHFDGDSFTSFDVEKGTKTKGILVDYKITNNHESKWLERFQFEVNILISPNKINVIE